jgi:hypothetical protein
MFADPDDALNAVRDRFAREGETVEVLEIAENSLIERKGLKPGDIFLG